MLVSAVAPFTALMTLPDLGARGSIGNFRRFSLSLPWLTLTLTFMIPPANCRDTSVVLLNTVARSTCAVKRNHLVTPSQQAGGACAPLTPARGAPPSVDVYVAVEDDPFGGATACPGGHGQGIGDEFGAHVIGHRIAQPAARAQIEHRGQIQPPLTGRDVGDVANPGDIRLAGIEPPADQVRQGRGVLGWIVVRTFAGLWTPTMAWIRMSRSTRSWFTSKPWARSSAVMRGWP